jgi:hypothetical protein
MQLHRAGDDVDLQPAGDYRGVYGVVQHGIELGAQAPDFLQRRIRPCWVQQLGHCAFQRFVHGVPHRLQLELDRRGDVHGQTIPVQTGNHVSELRHGPAARRDGAVPARTAQGHDHLATALLRDHDRIEPSSLQVLRLTASFTNPVPHAGEQLRVRVDDPPGSEDASGLFVREHGEDQVARCAATGVGTQRGVHQHGDAALHVERPTTPQIAVDDLAAERAMAPVLVDRSDDVDVALKQKRRSLAATFDAGNEIRPAWLALVARVFDMGVGEEPLDQLDRKVLLARRVGGVQPDQIAGELDCEGQGGHPGTVPLAD